MSFPKRWIFRHPLTGEVKLDTEDKLIADNFARIHPDYKVEVEFLTF